MKLTFLKDVELEIVTGLDDDGEPITETETFRKDTTVEVDRTGINEIQFGDGSVAYVTDEFWTTVE